MSKTTVHGWVNYFMLIEQMIEGIPLPCNREVKNHDVVVEGPAVATKQSALLVEPKKTTIQSLCNLPT